ncbi:MAG: hypothetical protein LBF97_01215 [Elusimicrobiota bacterium]|jgi:hypothetical protein|nr:hypothetical protein [Elusimicrobiota bacterium]
MEQIDLKKIINENKELLPVLLHYAEKTVNFEKKYLKENVYNSIIHQTTKHVFRYPFIKDI